MDDILQTQDATLSKMTKQPHGIATPVLTQMPALAPAPMPAPITAFSSSLSPPVVNVPDPISLPVGPSNTLTQNLPGKKSSTVEETCDSKSGYSRSVLLAEQLLAQYCAKSVYMQCQAPL